MDDLELTNFIDIKQIQQQKTTTMDQYSTSFGDDLQSSNNRSLKKNNNINNNNHDYDGFDEKKSSDLGSLFKQISTNIISEVFFIFLKLLLEMFITDFKKRKICIFKN
jgi:hypothetical protein